MQCYVDHQVYTYNEPNGQRVGYISPNVDLIQVTQIRNDGWVYGSYPGKNGRVSRWFRMSDLCADTNYSNRFAYVQSAQRVLRTNNDGNTIGSVSNNEPVMVIADNGNRVQIIYRLDNGTGYKMGWIPSSAVTGGSPINNTVTLQNGYYRIQPMHDLGRSVDALGPQIGRGNNVHMWSNGDTLQQKFYLQNHGNGYFSLQSQYGSKLYVTANGNGDGANLYTDVWNGSDSQLFRLVNAGNGSYHIFAKVGNNLNFDCAGGGKSDGNNVQLWTTGDSAWHKWRFVSVSLNPTPTPTPNGLLFPLKGSITTSSNVKTKGYNCDYRAPSGTPVYAPTDGTVNFRQSYAVNYGKLASYGNNFVFTSSDGQYKITCAHLSSFNNVGLRYSQSLSYPCSASKYKCSTISLGTRNVRKGDLIGYTGMTGNASGPHIHIEVTKNGTPVDLKAVFTTWQ